MALWCAAIADAYTPRRGARLAQLRVVAGRLNLCPPPCEWVCAWRPVPRPWLHAPPIQNADLFTLTYGAMVTQLVKDYEDMADVNTQLERM